MGQGKRGPGFLPNNPRKWQTQTRLGAFGKPIPPLAACSAVGREPSAYSNMVVRAGSQFRVWVRITWRPCSNRSLGPAHTVADLVVLRLGLGTYISIKLRVAISKLLAYVHTSRTPGLDYPKFLTVPSPSLAASHAPINAPRFQSPLSTHSFWKPSLMPQDCSLFQKPGTPCLA